MILRLDPANPLGWLAGVGVVLSSSGRSRWQIDRYPFTLDIETPMDIADIAQLVLGDLRGQGVLEIHSRYRLVQRDDWTRVQEYHRNVMAGMIVRDLTGRWKYGDKAKGTNLRIDPMGVNPPYAYCATDPATTPMGTNMGAQVCALRAIHWLGDACWHGNIMAWPVWTEMRGVAFIRRAIKSAPMGWRGAVGVSGKTLDKRYWRMVPGLIHEGGQHIYEGLDAARIEYANWEWRKSRESKKDRRKLWRREVKRMAA